LWFSFLKLENQFEAALWGVKACERPTAFPELRKSLTTFRLQEENFNIKAGLS
jgi:hypothetical protein